MHSLMISATVWVVDRIHGDTADGRVGFASSLGSIMCCTGLHQRLLGTAAVPYTHLTLPTKRRVEIAVEATHVKTK